MSPVEIIAHKRDGGSLSRADIAAFIAGFTQGSIPDYQMSALAMAIFLRGMNTDETAALTEEMLDSGTVLSWPAPASPEGIGGSLKVDKHSTGGVGDKVSLVQAPLLACCGLCVPMISGRGLGPSGGTIDKLEAIPGFRTWLTIAELQEITERVGCVITGTTLDIAPADSKLYALRDVTATVESIPLITASIMSKKLAENLDALVLDVKFGSGAFMKTLDDARMLARSLVDTGMRMGVKTSALLTDMNQPLGRMVGHAVEVNETIAALEGNGPADLMEVVYALTHELLLLTERTTTRAESDAIIDGHIASGRGLAKFREMVQAQGGDLDAPRPVAHAFDILAARGGFLARIDTGELGHAVVDLGGGRRVKTDHIDHSVGLEMLVRVGDHVDAGQPIVRLFAQPIHRHRVLARISQAFTIAEEAPQPLPLIAERIAG